MSRPPLRPPLLPILLLRILLDDETLRGEDFATIPLLRNLARSLRVKRLMLKDISQIMEIYDLILVRDFGYPALNPLHYGLSNYELYLNNNQGIEYYYDQVEDDQPQKAIALFPFHAENDNELELAENQLISVLYRHGQGWLVGEDENGRTGLIPEEFVQLVASSDDQGWYGAQEQEATEECDTAAAVSGSALSALVPQSPRRPRPPLKPQKKGLPTPSPPADSLLLALDLQIDNTELRPFLPGFLDLPSRWRLVLVNLGLARMPVLISLGSGLAKSFGLMPVLVSYGLLNKSALMHLFSLGLSPKTAVYREVLFGGGLKQNVKMGLSLLRSFMEEKAPNLLSKDNYFTENSVFLNKSDEDWEIDSDRILGDLEEGLEVQDVSLGLLEPPLPDLSFTESKGVKQSLEKSMELPETPKKEPSLGLTPVTLTPVALTPLLGIRIPKSLTMKSISAHSKKLMDGQGGNRLKRVLSRKFSRIKLN